VLSGNRNFEGRISPDVKMNYLASPPLVVAYALAGHDGHRLETEPLGQDPTATTSSCATSGPRPRRSRRSWTPRSSAEMFTKALRRRLRRRRALAVAADPRGQHLRVGRDSTYVRKPPYFDGMPAEPAPVEDDIAGARVLAKLGDSVTTDHISPAGSIKADSRRQVPREHGVERKDFNSYGSRRGNHEVMIRGTFANIRLQQPARSTASRAASPRLPEADGPQTTIYDAARLPGRRASRSSSSRARSTAPGSSRDWAAKGTALLGVKAVIAESYERIHRSNLIGMGVLPLQFPAGETRDSLGLTAPRPSTSGRDRAQRRRHPRQDGEGHRDQADGGTSSSSTRRAHRHPR
jgi:aconitate hydratase